MAAFRDYAALRSVSSHLPPGTLIAGKYALEGLLGEGGMGAVYQATNLSIGRRVAIKILNAAVSDREDVRRRFELEAKAAAVIDHPGIVDVLDMGQTDEGEPFIVMEHLEGITLRALFKELRCLTPGQAVGVMAPVLEALAAAHRAGVIHRDVKPANIFVCARPQVVKLLDFGVSRFGQSSGLTQTGSTIGTPRYMAPEQVLGEDDLGPEADLYSVGAVLYTLLSGRPPHGSGSDLSMLARVLNETPPALATLTPHLPPALTSLVDTLLLKDRAQRPRDAAKVKAQLLAAVPTLDTEGLFDVAVRTARAAALSPTPSSSAAGLPPRRLTPGGVARVAPAEPTLLPRPSRTPLVVGLTLVGLLGGAGAIAFLVQRPPEQAPLPPPPVELVVPAHVDPPPPPATLTLTLLAEPATARFSEAGVELTCNPCTLSGERGSRRVMRVAAPGMVDTSVELIFDATRTERVVLAARPVAPEVPFDAGVPAKKKKTSRVLSVDEKNPYE